MSDQTHIEGEVTGYSLVPKFGDQINLWIAEDYVFPGPTGFQLFFRPKTPVTIDGVAATRNELVNWLLNFDTKPVSVRPRVKITVVNPTHYVPDVTAEFTTHNG